MIHRVRVRTRCGAGDFGPRRDRKRVRTWSAVCRSGKKPCDFLLSSLTITERARLQRLGPIPPVNEGACAAVPVFHPFAAVLIDLQLTNLVKITHPQQIILNRKGDGEGKSMAKHEQYSNRL